MVGRSSLNGDYIIREAEERDEAQLIGLLRQMQSYLNPMHLWGKPVDAMDAWYLQAARTQNRARDGFIFVADQGGEVLGYAWILTNCEADGSDDDVAYSYARVVDLAVIENARRQGIGQALLARCETMARAKGRKAFRIDVLAKNAAAESAYLKFGFQPYLNTLEKILE
jgi:GNAT superfamily N-acetyltransferase